VRRRPEAVRAAILVVALASMLLLAGPVTPPAAADGCDGVWVVVDARAAGGTLTTRCAPGDPSTGLEALARAGHASTFVPRIPGMVCTIDARPEPCNGAPADAYWSYWYAEAGGSWTYATTGAGTRDPAPGSVEGWRFGDGTASPGTPPPTAPAPTPPPEPEPTPAPEPAAPAPSSPGATGSVDTAPPRAGGGTASSENASSPAADAGAAGRPEAGSPAVPEPPVPETDDATEQRLLDPRTSPSLPRPDPVPAPARRVDPAPTESPSQPGPEAPPTTDATEVGGASLAASTSEEPTGPVPVGPMLAVGLLVGVGSLTWRQRRRVAGAGS
jgi:hypothetical protein